MRDSTAMVASARALIAQLSGQGIIVRALGGIAVALRCPSASRPPLCRQYQDIDLLTTREFAHELAKALCAAGYQPAERFNALHGHSRLMFTSSDGTHLDVLVGDFVMCHRLDMGDRLTLHHETLALSDLLLTKLQIAQLNYKDIIDSVALLLDHSLTEDDTGINQSHIAPLLADDWGWWRTVTTNCARLVDVLPTLDLKPAEAEIVEARVCTLVGAIERRRKTVRWRVRARIGDRVPWRTEPEEVAF